MRMKLLGSLGLLTFATALAAQDAAPVAERASAEHRFQQMDRDANARIDLEEFRNRASRRFHRLDADQSGALDAGEIPASMSFPAAELPLSLERWQDAIPARFAAIDANGDGGIDLGEWRSERDRRAESR
jgi:Ca2+-binding EF-hand superfamily protein